MVEYKVSRSRSQQMLENVRPILCSLQPFCFGFVGSGVKKKIQKHSSLSCYHSLVTTVWHLDAGNER